MFVMICTFPSSSAIFNLGIFFPHVTSCNLNALGNLTTSLLIDISSLIPKESTVRIFFFKSNCQFKSVYTTFSWGRDDLWSLSCCLYFSSCLFEVLVLILQNCQVSFFCTFCWKKKNLKNYFKKQENICFYEYNNHVCCCYLKQITDSFFLMIIIIVILIYWTR